MKPIIDLDNVKILDLTHALSPMIPNWHGDCGFRSEISCDYSDCSGDVKFRTQKLQMPAGIGTHMDAPLHCFQFGHSITDIPLKNLIAPCIKMDISEKAHEHYQLSVSDIQLFENHEGAIPPKSLIIIYTGWEKYWSQPDKYRNHLQFPSVSKTAAEYLLSKNILGIGIDTLSPDCGQSGFPVHQIILGADKYIIENVANAHRLPATGAFALAFPLKIEAGTEAPLRLLGLTPKSCD